MAEQADGRIAVRVLVVAMFGFLVNFWAWALISPLGNSYGEALGLTGCAAVGAGRGPGDRGLARAGSPSAR